MTFLQIILLSSIFGVIFIILHFLFLYLISFTKIAQTIFPFILSNFICFYFFKNFEIHKFFYDSLVINFAIFIIYVEFLLLLKKGFTLSIITSFKNTFIYKNIITIDLNMITTLFRTVICKIAL